MDLHKEGNRLAADAGAVIEDVKQLMRAAGAETGADLQELRQQVDGRLSALAQRLARMERSALERGRGTVRATDGYVRDHPWTAIAATAAAAILIGALLARRH